MTNIVQPNEKISAFSMSKANFAETSGALYPGDPIILQTLLYKYSDSVNSMKSRVKSEDISILCGLISP